ncbi:hypothetical protein LXL04_037356 [Taraxacum kok-saghyz]
MRYDLREFCTTSTPKNPQLHHLELEARQKMVHKSCSTMKVRCFIWRALMNRIPVANNLLCRGITVQNSLCQLCNNEQESVDHLLVNCSYTKCAMDWIYKWCGIQLHQVLNIGDLIHYAANWGNCPKKRTILTSILYCSICCIWLERNNRLFKNKKVPPTKLADEIITLSYTWCNYRSKYGCGTWASWGCSLFNHSY